MSLNVFQHIPWGMHGFNKKRFHTDSSSVNCIPITGGASTIQMILCRRPLLLPEMQLSNYSADKNKPWFPHSLTICSLHYECFSDPHRRWEGAGHPRVPDSLTFVPTSQLMRLGRVQLSHPTPPCPVHPTTVRSETSKIPDRLLLNGSTMWMTLP